MHFPLDKEDPIQGRVRGAGISRIADCSSRRHDLQALATLFQRSVVPMPSFSKDSFGGFVGFQEVTIDPNPKCRSPNFLAP
jgi:hypothetical protein